MAQQTINIGASPNDGTGTPLRTAFQSTNSNFTELYTALGGGVGLPGATTQVIFNDGGTNLAGDAGLVYNKTTDALTVAGLVTAGSATITGAATVGTTLGVTGVSTLTGNVGVGVTPSAWNSDYKPIDIGANGCIAGRVGGSNTLDIISNGFRNAAGTYVYKSAVSTPAARYLLDGSTGSHIWFSGVAGTAGNTIAGFTTAAMTLNTAGNLAFPSGKGIDFSAVTGGTGTATANVLNDYEEGTFTPTISSGATAVTYGTQLGSYTKVGRLVTVIVHLSTNSATLNGSLLVIAGLPFAVPNFGAGVVAYSNNGFVSTPSGNKPNLYLSGSVVDFYTSSGSAFLGTNLGSSAFDVRFTATYFA